MAYDTLRASGNNQYGQMSDVERANFGSAQSAQDFILRKRLQDEALARQDASQDKAFTHADQSQARAFAEGRVTGGTFEDRERLADARIDRAVAPALLHEQNAQADWQAMRDDTAGERGLYKNLMDRVTGAAGAGTGTEEMMRLYGQLKNPALIGAEERRAQDRKWSLEDQKRNAMATTIQQALVAAAGKNDMTTVAKLQKMQADIYGEQPGMPGAQGSGVPDAITEGLKPTAAQTEAIGDEAAAAASTGFDFQNSLAEMDALAKDVRNGRASPDEVAHKAQELLKRLVARHIPEEQAKQMIGKQLDKTLPGLGRDILSALQATVATPFRAVGSLFGGNADAFENVGAASELRNRLKGDGFLR